MAMLKSAVVTMPKMEKMLTPRAMIFECCDRDFSSSAKLGDTAPLPDKVGHARSRVARQEWELSQPSRAIGVKAKGTRA